MMKLNVVGEADEGAFNRARVRKIFRSEKTESDHPVHQQQNGCGKRALIALRRWRSLVRNELLGESLFGSRFDCFGKAARIERGRLFVVTGDGVEGGGFLLRH